MIKATDFIFEENLFFVKQDKYRRTFSSKSLKDACNSLALKLVNEFGNYKDFSLFEPERVARASKIAQRFEREFIRTSTGFREEDVFYFDLFLQFEPTLKEVMRAFREDVIFYGNVHINSINEIKKYFKENYKRVSDIREIFNKGYGAYLVKARFTSGDFDEPSYWDLEVISHYKF